MTHLYDLNGLFNLIQLFGSLLNQMFEFRPLFPKTTLCEQNQDIMEINMQLYTMKIPKTSRILTDCKYGKEKKVRDIPPTKLPIILHIQ